MTTPIRIAIVDDHPLFREGVARSLGEIGGFELVGEGASAEDAERLVRASAPDILMLDISMPGGGLNALASILSAVPEQKIVMLTVSETNADVAQALKAGARGYVLKGVGSKSLSEILRDVASGQSYVSPTLYFRPSTAGPIYGLPANYPTPSFNAYGIFSTYTFGPPYDFAWPGDVTFYPYGTTFTTSIVEPYNYTGPYVGPLLYRP